MPTIVQVKPPNHLDIPENPTAGQQFNRLIDSVVSLEPLSVILRQYVEYALARHGGNVTEAAKRLGINRRTISRWREGYERTDVQPSAKRRVRPTAT